MLKRENHPNWKGGQFKRNGYVYILKPEHPFCQKQGYVKRCRIIIEQKIGRYLKRTEPVHHINRIKDDDRIENLKLFSSNAEHISQTNKGHIHTKRKYQFFNNKPIFLKEGEIVTLPFQKQYICKKCIICNSLFWTKKRTERPITKTCSRKCLSKLATQQLIKNWKDGKYNGRLGSSR